MKQPFLIALLLIASGTTSATTISCPSEKQLAGTYKTTVADGFTPNRLAIVPDATTQYKAQLISYWAAKPFDNGRYGTVGDFESQLFVPMPWSCTAFIYVEEKDVAEGQRGAVCVLAIRFVGPTSIHVNAMGQCDVFHGHRAYPDGLYTREVSK
jgi:hypothetical protein